MAGIPYELGTATGCLRIANPPYRELRLWLLSLLWRMAIATGPIWRNVQLSEEPDLIRELLVKETPGAANHFPVGLILPSFDGKRLDFSFEPDVVDRESKLVRAAFGGLLFFFELHIDATLQETDQFYLRPNQDWNIPIDDWQNIDFVRAWVHSLYRQAVKKQK